VFLPIVPGGREKTDTLTPYSQKTARREGKSLAPKDKDPYLRPVKEGSNKRKEWTAKLSGPLTHLLNRRKP